MSKIGLRLSFPWVKSLKLYHFVINSNNRTYLTSSRYLLLNSGLALKGGCKLIIELIELIRLSVFPEY